MFLFDSVSPFAMWLSIASLPALMLVASVSGANLYIQDYPLFTELVPCAQSALVQPVNHLTYSKCPDDAVGLQSCACTKDTNSASVLDDIATTMGYSCGSGAVEDLKSANALFSLYCNLSGSTAITTPAPNPNTVTDYIWDISAYSDLAGCAASALANAVAHMTFSLCHDDPAALESCACTKNQNSRSVSLAIKTTIGYSCGSTATDDLSSALAVWDGYCQLGNGTTKFPTRTPLAGAVSYNIWDLTQYAGLVPCAQSALRDKVARLTASECPSGPLELVSCACMKDRKSADLSRDLVTTVGYSCGSDAKADVSSAQAVFAYYCSAGKGLVTPEGITVSATTTRAGSNGSGTSSRTSDRSGELPAKTSSSSVESFPTGTSSGSTKTSKSTNVGAIAGGVVGGLAILILAAIAIWRYRRKHAKSAAIDSGPSDSQEYSRSELGGKEMEAAPAKSLIPRKPAPAINEKPPVSPIDSNPAKEMYTPPATNRSEVPGGPGLQEMPNDRPLHEMYGSQQQPFEVSAPSATMNEGPFYEMDGREYRQ